MFFSISRSPKLNFSVNGHYHRGWHLDMDQGWNILEHNRETIAYKGYLDHGDLDLEIYNIVDNNVTRSGNYCIIILSDETAQVRHSFYRSFPLWYDPEHGVTNLQPLSRRIFADSVITLNKDLSFHTDLVDVIGEVPLKESALDPVVDTIDEILTEKFDYFFSLNDLPVKIFVSGGVDTALMLSYLRKLEIPHEVVLAEHIEFDRFWVKNHYTLTQSNWAYQQMHHWTSPTILVSGCPGDEFTLRNPEMGNLLALHHNTSINQLLENRDCLHREYLKLDDNQQKFRNQTIEQISDRPTLYRHLLDRAINDHQHWHLGKTLTFTPLRELKILKYLLMLPWEEQVEQILDSKISRILIERNDPSVLKILSTQKNHNNYLENLVNILPR